MGGWGCRSCGVIVGLAVVALAAWIARNQAERDSFRRAERHALEKLKDQQREYQKARDRFQRMHRHFYVVEAAKQLAPQQVVVLRRFGSIIDQKTPHSASEIIAQMMSSLRCESATPRP